MSVQSEINRITTAVANAYDAVDDIGGTLPASETVGNLATAISSCVNTVTETYTHVSSVAPKSKVLHGSAYYQKIVPDDGYLISSVTVMMGNVDITSQVFSGDTGSGGGGGGGITPTGEIEITENGTYDVTQYASADVNVPSVSPDLGTKSISANGTYNASSDSLDGYSQVTVSVPNSYSASDEGKVVSSGTLVSQSSQNITTNGTYDTTLKNQVVVNVSSKAVYKYEGLASRTANSYGSTSATVTVSKAGTYNISYVAIRGSSSGTMGTNLYIGSTGKGNQQTFNNGTYGQYVSYTDQSISANTAVTIYATSGNNSRTIYVGQLIVEEV